METEVVYVVSPDFGAPLFASLGTLLATESTYDRIRIYCVGERPPDWTFRTNDIQVEEVDTLSHDFFLLNKTYLTRSPADRVVFLDADTLVIRSLDHLWVDSEADLLAREDPFYYREDWDEEGWKEQLQRVSAPPFPYLNSGVLVFQHGSHRQLASRWPALTRQGRSQETPFHMPRLQEQVAFSLAAAEAELSLDIMDRTKHAYAWGQDPPSESVVYHTGTRTYYPRIYPVLTSGTAGWQIPSQRPWGPSTRTLAAQLLRTGVRRMGRRAKRYVKSLIRR